MVPCRRGTVEDARSVVLNDEDGVVNEEAGLHEGHRRGLLEMSGDERHVPAPAEALPLWALETDGSVLRNVAINLPAVVALGHEQYGVSEPVRSGALASGGIVTIPHAGPKQSLNVGVAAGILLYELSQGL